jgi:hypothetical protein
LIVISVISAAASSGNKDSSTNNVAPKPSASASKKANSGGGSNNSLDHPEDVTIQSCASDEAGFATAKVVVTNNSSKPSTYFVEVAFDSKADGSQIGTGNVFVDQLQSGQQSSPQDANSLQTAPASGYTCKVVSSQRTASS